MSEKTKELVVQGTKTELEMTTSETTINKGRIQKLDIPIWNIKFTRKRE